MIRFAKLLICDNEHGIGEVTFPDIYRDPDVLAQQFIQSPTVGQMRKAAKEKGWSGACKNDFCDLCTFNEAEANGSKD